MYMLISSVIENEYLTGSVQLSIVALFHIHQHVLLLLLIVVLRMAGLPSCGLVSVVTLTLFMLCSRLERK